MKRGTWLNTFEGGAISLAPGIRDALFAIWDPGDNVLLAWTHDGEVRRRLQSKLKPGVRV